MSEDPRNHFADNLFHLLIGDGAPDWYIEEAEVRSAPYTPTVDVKLEEQWYRIELKPIDEPIPLAVHRGDEGQ